MRKQTSDHSMQTACTRLNAADRSKHKPYNNQSSLRLLRARSHDSRCSVRFHSRMLFRAWFHVDFGSYGLSISVSTANLEEIKLWKCSTKKIILLQVRIKLFELQIWPIKSEPNTWKPLNGLSEWSTLTLFWVHNEALTFGVHANR